MSCNIEKDTDKILVNNALKKNNIPRIIQLDFGEGMEHINRIVHNGNIAVNTGYCYKNEELIKISINFYI